MSTTPKKLLFLTSSDYGQANVVLATTYALFALEALVEIHVGSEHALEPEIKQVMKLAEETLGISTTPSKIHFHGIKGDSQFTAVSRPATGISDIWQLPVPNFANSAAFLRRFSHVRGFFFGGGGSCCFSHLPSPPPNRLSVQIVRLSMVERTC